MTVQRDEGRMPVAVRVDDAAYWLEEWHQVMQLPEAEVEQTRALREEEFARSQNPRNRLRLALLLALGPPAVRDQHRARELLADLDPASLDESANALAALLEQVTREQLAASDRTRQTGERLKESETRIEELERQLQELTTIEQSIQQRE
jgi:hypothetical protein